MQIADALSDVAVWHSLDLAEDDTVPSATAYWPQLTDTLWALASSPSVVARESALRVLRDVPRLLTSAQMRAAAPVLSASLGGDAPPSLRATAAGLVASFVMVCTGASCSSCHVTAFRTPRTPSSAMPFCSICRRFST